MDEYDSVIVLSYRHNNGVITDQSKNRVDLGIRLYSESEARSLCFSGKAAKAMESYAKENGFEGRILLEDSSEDTVGNALFTKLEFSRNEKWKNLLVVSSDYHISRVKKIFNFVYAEKFNLDFFGSAGNFPPKDEKSEAEKLEIFLSFFHGIKPGDDMAIIGRLTKSHELYKNRPDLRAQLMGML
ncbi:YdcF family protein [Candidatus Pacearchaeota archaeon]|nr:YdcF family protein [Candidatus Pacearchaeota archaeon]